MTRNIFIHIGKCGGLSARRAIEGNSLIKIDQVVHIRQPPIEPQAVYYVLVRSPISRALSAFNWRYKLVVTDRAQSKRFPGEAVLLKHYRSLNALAESLYREDGSADALVQGNFRSIHHLGESISFYLDDLLTAITPDQVGAVLTQEYLDADLKRIFGAAPQSRGHENKTATPPEQLQLSTKAKENLRRFLVRDFACLDKLREWGKLSEEAHAKVTA